MSFLARTEQLIDVVRELDDVKARDFEIELENVADRVADWVANRLGVTAGKAHCEPHAFDGCCVALSPKEPGQPLPEILEQLDVDDPNEWPE